MTKPSPEATPKSSAATVSYFAHDECGATWALPGIKLGALCPNCNVWVVRRPRRNFTRCEQDPSEVCGSPDYCRENGCQL